MIAPWVREEMATADLKDKRLKARLIRILSGLAERPVASIPAACGGHTETVAAYRFFDNDNVTCERILQPHFEATRQRMAAQQVALLVADTTELDLTRPQQQVEGAGPMDSVARRGAYLHLTEAFTPDGTPLGAVAVETWTRDEEHFCQPQVEKRKQRKASRIEEKESFRWLQGLREARRVAQELPHVQCIYVADSEADIYHLFVEPRGERPVDWVIRACQQRCVCDEKGASGKTIREELMLSPVLFSKEITVRGRKAKTACETRKRRTSRDGRATIVEVRAAVVTLHPPAQSDRPLPAVTVNVVMVCEVDVAEGEEPVEWILLTTLPIATVEEVRQIIQYYCVRWMIEIVFRTLKSGCRVEERLFEHIDRLLPCVAVYLIVAWRTLMLVRLGRSCPDLNCEAVFDPAEWKSVWMVIYRKTPPRKPPKLVVMLRLIGQLGGYVNRPNRRDLPGPQTTWLGLQRARDLAWAWNTFGPGAGGIH
jgi:Transposase DNA-binding/Transposase Tn5 dimerisation domain/Transposase DDE domain